MKSFIELWEDAIKKDLNTAFHKDCEDKIPKELFRQKTFNIELMKQLDYVLLGCLYLY